MTSSASLSLCPLHPPTTHHINSLSMRNLAELVTAGVQHVDDVLILDLLLGELRLALKELHILPVGLVVRLVHVYISSSASASAS